MKCPHCHKAIRAEDVARYLGSIKSPAKAVASRANGAKGGRPRKVKPEVAP